MTEDDIRLDRRGLLASFAALVSAPPAEAMDVSCCAEMLARALAAEHGGKWRIHVDTAGVMVMVIREFSEQT